MSAIGWVLIIMGALLIRQGAIGRGEDLPADASEAFASLARLDWDGLTEVASRRGADSDPSIEVQEAPAIADASAFGGTASSTGLVSEMQRLAGIANYRYVWGATGPRAYDCSGLVWRAMLNLGIYRGPRFTTSTVENSMRGKLIPVSAPSTGDMVLWPGQHMGISIGGGKIYAAKSSASGIGVQDIARARRSRPKYYRIGAS